MNTAQQVAAVTAIIKIRKKVIQTNDANEVADLIEQAVALSANVPANENLDTLDKTRSKEWNLIAMKRLIKTARENTFESIEALHAEVTASLLRLSMVFVDGELEDLNKMLSESFMNRGVSTASRANMLYVPKKDEDDYYEE